MSLEFFNDIFIPEHALKSPQFFDEVGLPPAWEKWADSSLHHSLRHHLTGAA